jgi:hypothetical protein
MNLVPADCRDEKIPCRHIPLNAQGFTIDTYYRLGTHEETETALAAWLRKTIKELEAKRVQTTPIADAVPPNGCTPRHERQ